MPADPVTPKPPTTKKEIPERRGDDIDDLRKAIKNLELRSDQANKNMERTNDQMVEMMKLLKGTQAKPTTTVTNTPDTGIKLSTTKGTDGNEIIAIESLELSKENQAYVDAVEAMSPTDKKQLAISQEGYLKTLTNNKLKFKGQGYNTTEWKQQLYRYINSINPRLLLCLEALLPKIDPSKIKDGLFPEVEYPEDVTPLMLIQVTQAIQGSLSSELTYLTAEVAQSNCLQALHNVLAVCHPNTAVQRMTDLTAFITIESDPKITNTGQYAAQLKLAAKEINSRNGSVLISDELLCAKLLGTVKKLSNYKDVYEATVVSIEGSDVQELNFSRISSRLAAISTAPVSTKHSASMAKLRGGKFGHGNREYKERDRNKDKYKNRNPYVTGKILKGRAKGEKKQPCFNVLNGQKCPFGDNCHFSHKFIVQMLSEESEGEEESKANKRPSGKGASRGGKSNANEKPKSKKKKIIPDSEREESDGDSSDAHAYKSNLTCLQKAKKQKLKPTSPSNSDKSSHSSDSNFEPYYSGSAIRYHHRSNLSMASKPAAKQTGINIFTVFSYLLLKMITCVGSFFSYLNGTVHTCSTVFKTIGKPKKMIILDSGCTFPMTGDENIFVGETVKNCKEYVTLANGSQALATKKGLAIIGSKVMECLYVEGFETLVSKSWLIDQRFSSVTTISGAETFYDHQGKPYLTFKLHPTLKLFLLSELDETRTHTCNQSA